MLREVLIKIRDLFLESPIIILAFFKVFRVILMKSDVKYMRKGGEKSLTILANGPSGRETYVAEADCDLAVVNFFALDASFQRYKPSHYILIDPLFFEKDDDKHRLLIERLNEVDWCMALYLPANFNRVAKKIFINNNIKVKFIRHNPCFMNNAFFYWMYKKNLFTPRFQNVINAAVYLGINSGYKQIFLHGVETSEFVNYSVDFKNEVYLNTQHFYGKSSINMTREGRIEKGGFWRYLRYYTYMLESYSHLEKYSKYIECEIINYTTNSFIDSFEKR